MKMSPNIDELYENYKAVLKSHFPEEFRRLLRIEENNIDGAKFQAALAAILQFLVKQVEMVESILFVECRTLNSQRKPQF